MGWIKKIAKAIIAPVAPAPVIIKEVAEGKSVEEAVKEVVTAPVKPVIDIGSKAAGLIAEIDNKLTQLEASLAERVGGTQVRNLFLDIRHILQPLDPQLQKRLADSAQRFVETLDFSNLNPLVPFLAGELERAKNNFWDKAAPIPQHVLDKMPTELTDLGRHARYIRVEDVNEISLPAFAIQHFGKAKAVAIIDLIFFEIVPNSESLSDRFFWAHELTHLVQYRKLGLIGFADKYFGEECKKIGNNNHINALEVEADQTACKYFHGANPHYITICP